jgi:hypothetical protein
MRVVNPRRLVPWFILLALLAGGITLWLMFVGQQQFYVRMGFENQLEHIADELFRGRLEGRLHGLPDGIDAFAIYDPQGQKRESWGQNSPDTVDPVILPFLPAIEHTHGIVTLVKALQPLGPRLRSLIGPPPPGPGPGDMWMRRPGPPSETENQGFLFVSVEAAPLVSRQRMWMMGGMGGVVAWGGLMTLIGWLWFRARRYQTALMQHRELLQFAQASRTLGHEIQNPLASILLQTALLKRSAVEVPNEVRVIEEEAQRISGLVTRVRDFLKDPQGQPEIVDLAALLQTLSGRFSEPIAIDGTKEPLFVRFDTFRLRSVVENLLKNAVESAPQGQPHARLYRPRSGWLRLEVTDSGPGFTPEALKHALDPFYTTKTTGTGIGLAIVDGFVRAASGKLRIENRAEGGARVTVDLPEVSGEVL